MPAQPAIDQTSFRRVLQRNVALPLAVGLATAIVFVALIFYLLNAMTWVEHSQRVIGDSNEIIKLAVDRETGMRGFLITGDESFLAPYNLGRAKLNTQIESLMELVSDNPPQVERLRRVKAIQAQWDQFAEETIAARRNNQDYQESIRSGRGKLEFDETRRIFDTFLNVEQRLLQERSDTAKNVTTTTVAAFLLFSLTLSGLLAFFGRRELVRMSDVFGAALRKQDEHAEFLQQQAWLRTGQNQLADRVVDQPELRETGRRILDFLADYLDVTVAALYSRGADGALHRTASHGFSRESEATRQTFVGNEGLVGQTATGQRLIHLEEVPDDYLKVSSGLGAGKPKNVVLLPVDSSGVVNGVVELGFMRKVNARDLEFLRLVASNIGAFVEAALSRERLQDAFAETQQLNEELQVQQEELRNANEELEEQSRSLEESQVNLENQKAELEQINHQLAKQAISLDQKNDALNIAHSQLEERADDLQRASQYKSEFLANMSHELRTPLNSSLILAKLLSENKDGRLSDEQVKFAQTIYSAGNDLLNLINDILDISKVEAGKLEINPEHVSLRHLVNAMKATFEPSAAQKSLTLILALDADAPPSIYTDKQRLEQILKNLMSNAIKFTEAGHVTLTIAPGSQDTLRFIVQDTGIGIAPDQQSRIFEAFQQADGTTSRRYGGSGLGLSISRDLTALLGGTIQLDSAPGQGSTLTLTLPTQWTERQDNTLPAATSALPPGPRGPTPAALAPSPAVLPVPAVLGTPAFDDDRLEDPSARRTVLVIEDEPEFAKILFDLAHEMQYRCLVAHTAVDGLHLATYNRPDAILLDIRLPDGSGLGLLQRLKEGPQTRHIPVHVVSASDRSETALYLGAIGYATKPTTREQLREIFHKLENKFTQKVKRVLLVEDDPRQRESVVQLIGDNDVEITAVESGEAALHHLADTLFDCMIIDLKLPDMQGEELLRRMSLESLCSFPPVIIYTGRNLTRDEEVDLLKYSRSIIIKGARSPERLLDEVTLFLHKVESELSTERQGMLKTVRSRDRVFEGRRILLVDDDIRNVFALTSALEHKGVLVEIGRNGYEAISKLDEVPDIDLVLMDIMMPGMDGLEATRQIRTDPRFKKLPIIAITAKAMKDDQEQCLSAGASDYLPKPVDLDRLYSLLRVWMPSLDRT